MPSAIKVLRYEALYQRERDVYLRLMEHKVIDICGFRVPEFLRGDEWRAEKREQFGDRWPIVQDIMREFRKLGIYLADVKPGNIMFKD